MTLNFVLGKNKLDHQKKMMELFKDDYQKIPMDSSFF